MKQPHDNSRYKHVSIVCYRWPVYTNIKFLVSDKHILGYENSKLTHHFTNVHSKKVKCTPKIEKKVMEKPSPIQEKNLILFSKI